MQSQSGSDYGNADNYNNNHTSSSDGFAFSDDDDEFDVPDIDI